MVDFPPDKSEYIHKLIFQRARWAEARMKHDAAWSLEDLIAEAQQVELTVRSKFDPTRHASYQTFLYRCLYTHFCDVVNQSFRCVGVTNTRREFAQADTYGDAEASDFIPDNREMAQEVRLSLSTQARQLLDCCLEPPPELAKVLDQKRFMTMAAVVREYLGWKLETLESVKAEMKEVLTDVSLSNFGVCRRPEITSGRY